MSDSQNDERRRNDPESLRLRGLSAGLTADDLDASMKFWIEGLGFTIKDRWEDDGKLIGVGLVAGDSYVGISQDDWSKGKDRVKGVGFRLFAETVQDIDELAKRIEEHGIEVDGPKDEWGSRLLTVIDPSGFKLTIQQKSGD